MHDLANINNNLKFILNSKRVNYCILEADTVVQSLKELKLTDNISSSAVNLGHTISSVDK